MVVGGFFFGIPSTLPQMKIFSWMRNRQNGKGDHNKRSPYPVSQNRTQQPLKEEFSDWPDGLLAIGTFGNQTLKGSCDDHKYIFRDMDSAEKCTDSLLQEDEKKVNNFSSHVPDNSMAKTSGIGIGKRSLSYLLKKTIICSGGFKPTPVVKDPLLPDPNSTMEKILRAMLHKKIYPQRTSPKTTSLHKYLDMDDEEHDDQHGDGAASPKSKWDKTDSEYIVLEI